MAKTTQDIIEDSGVSPAPKPGRDAIHSANSPVKPRQKAPAKFEADVDEDGDAFEDMFNDIPV